MKKILLIFMVIFIALTSVMTSCTPGKKKTGNEVEPTKKPNTANDCEIWWGGSAADDEIINSAIVDFINAYPEYQDKNIYASVPGQTDRNALEVAIAGKMAPSIYKFNYIDLPKFGESGNIINLADPKYGFDKKKDMFLDSTWNAVKFKEKVYGIPFDANTIAFLVNKDLLDEAGKAIPKTYDEVVEAGKAINALGKEGYYGYSLPFNNNYDTWLVFNYMFWVWRLGGDMLNADYTKATFNEGPGLEALEKMIDLVKIHKITSETTKEADFAGGKVGMIDMGSWWIPVVKGENAAANFVWAPMPTLKEGIPGHSGLGLFALGVISESAGNLNTQLSYKFAEFIGTTPKYSVQYGKAKELFPSLKEGLTDSFFTDDAHKVFVEQLKIAKPLPSISCYQQMEEIIALAINESASGERSPKEALDAAATRVNQLLSNNK